MERKEFKTRYLLLFWLILINVVVLFLLSLFNYKFFYQEEVQAFRDRYKDSASKEIELYASNMDIQLENMLAIPVLYFSDISDNSDMLYPQNHQIVGDTEHVRKLISILSKLQKTYPYLLGMDIYYEGSNTAVVNFTNVLAVDGDEQLYRYLPWTEGRDLDFDRAWLEYGRSSYPENLNTISYVQRITASRWNGKSIYVALHIDPFLFRQPNIGFYIRSFLLDSSNGNILLGRLDSDWQKEFFSNGQYLEDDNWQISNGDGKFTFVSNIIGQGNLSYCSFIGDRPNGIDYPDYSKRLVKNFFILMASNLMCLLMLSILNYLVYKNYISKFSRQVGIEGTKGISHTLESIEAKIEELNDESKILKQQKLVHSLLVNKAKKEEYEAVYESADGDYVCTVIAESEKDGYSISTEQIQVCVEELEKSFDGTIYYCQSSTPARCVFVFILKKPEVDTLDLAPILAIIPDAVLDVSRACLLRSNGFQNSFSSALDAHEYRFFPNCSTVLYNDELNLDSKKTYGDHLGLVSQIDKMVRLEQKESVSALVDKLFAQLSSGEYTVQYSKATLADLVSSIYSIISQNRIDMWTLVGYDIRVYSRRIKTIDSYKGWILSVIFAVIQSLSDNRISQANETSQRVVRIIEDNLFNNVSLGMIADELGIREDALSRSFKDMMGCNYMEYITGIKLKKAVELLYQGIPVQEISMRLGYRSPQYFIKVFKNEYGVTPHKFRMISNQEGKKE